MNGYADDPLISSLLNQPIIVWSLVISASIFVIAIGLWTVFKLRSRAQLRQSEKLAAENLAKEVDVAAKELIAEERANLAQLEINGQAATEDNTLVSGEIGERALETAVSGKESEDPANIIEVTNADDEKENAESEESEGSKSALANIFEDEIIVDPYIQAMRDNLPDINMSMLQKDTQLVIAQLLKRHDRVTRNLGDVLW